MSYLIGVDGGGSKTVVTLADRDGKVLQESLGPASLVAAARPDESAAVIAAAVREAARKAGVSGRADALCAGVAGAGDEAARSRVGAALARQNLARWVKVVTDAEVALMGALGGRPGVVLVAGTGSVALGKAEDGRTARCGGWGAEIGDEGSGYAVGRSALRTVMKMHDGRYEVGDLMPTLLSELNLTDPEALPGWVERATKGDVAALTPHVLHLAASGDGVCRYLAEAHAVALSECAVALLQRLGPWSGPPNIAAWGGLMDNAFYLKAVIDALEKVVPAFRLGPPEAGGAIGALHYAFELLESMEN